MYELNLNLQPLTHKRVAKTMSDQIILVQNRSEELHGSLQLDILWLFLCFAPLSPLICFSVLAGERVLCFHGPLLYEAKVCFRTTIIMCYELIINCKTNVSQRLTQNSVL